MAVESKYPFPGTWPFFTSSRCACYLPGWASLILIAVTTGESDLLPRGWCPPHGMPMRTRNSRRPSALAWPHVPARSRVPARPPASPCNLLGSAGRRIRLAPRPLQGKQPGWVCSGHSALKFSRIGLLVANGLRGIRHRIPQPGRFLVRINRRWWHRQLYRVIPVNDLLNSKLEKRWLL